MRFLVSLIISTFVLWAAQKIVLPESKERSFVSVLVLAFLWSIIGEFVTELLKGIPLIGGILALVVWIWVLKSYFDIGWMSAIAISFVAWVLIIIVGIVLGIAGGLASVAL